MSARAPRSHRKIALLGLLAILLFPAPAAADTLEQYRAALERTLATAERQFKISGASGLAQDPALAAELSRLEAIREVTAASGAAIVLDNSGLVDHLRNGDDLPKTIGNLRALLSEIDAMGKRTTWTSEVDLHVALESTFTRAEFRGQANPAGQFLDNLRSRLFRWLEGLLPSIGLPNWIGQSAANAWFVVLLLLAAGCLVFAVAFFGFNYRSARHNLVRRAVLPETKRIVRDDPERVWRAAQQAAAVHDYRLAIHYLYLWAVLRLAAKSRLRFDRSLTNHEQLQLLTAAQASGMVGSVVDTFDRVWYGHEPCGADRYKEFSSSIERLVEIDA